MPHMRKLQEFSSRNSVCEGAVKLFHDWVGENFSGDAFDLRLRLLAVQPPLQRKFEILALADLFQTLIAHLLERALDGFALRIENAFLQRDVNVGFHGSCNYTSGPGDARNRRPPRRRTLAFGKPESVDDINNPMVERMDWSTGSTFWGGIVRSFAPGRSWPVPACFDGGGRGSLRAVRKPSGGRGAGFLFRAVEPPLRLSGAAFPALPR